MDFRGWPVCSRSDSLPTRPTPDTCYDMAAGSFDGATGAFGRPLPGGMGSGRPKVNTCSERRECLKPPNERMQLTWLLGAPSRPVSVHRRAVGRCGLGSPATQLMRAVRRSLANTAPWATRIHETRGNQCHRRLNFKSPSRLARRLSLNVQHRPRTIWSCSRMTVNLVISMRRWVGRGSEDPRCHLGLRGGQHQ